MIGSAFGQSNKRAIFLFVIMESEVVDQRMEKAQIRLHPPLVAFEFITGMATVDQIIETILSAMNAGQKVVNGHFRAYIGFTNAAIPAPKVMANTDRLAQGTSHC